MTTITSPHNSRIKHLIKLQKKSSERITTNTFVIEGRKEIQQAIQGGYKCNELYICPTIYNQEKNLHHHLKTTTEELITIPKEVYEKIAYRKTTEGIIGIFEAKNTPLPSPKSNALYIIAESLEKPGNIGAIFRTGDAIQADGIILCETATDIYNPNTIRASLGSIFTVPHWRTNNTEAHKFLTKHSIQAYATGFTKEATNYSQEKYQKSCAIIVGREDCGLNPFWIKNAHQVIHIPMLGSVNSLNVSVATAIIAYEIIRQRTSQNHIQEN